MRQPQLCMSASLKVEDNSKPKPAPRNELMPWLANCQLATKPRLPGMCSTRNAVELPNSPPAEKPCTSRATITSSGARRPICAYVGMQRHRQRAERHHHDRQQQRGLAAVAVGIGAEQHAADRPRQECQREAAEGQQQGYRRVFVGKERLGEIDREIGIDRDVEPFERIAERGRDHEPGDVLAARRRYFWCFRVCQSHCRCPFPVYFLISPRSQNSPAMMPSASSVTSSRMCSSGACCEQPG